MRANQFGFIIKLTNNLSIRYHRNQPELFEKSSPKKIPLITLDF